NVVLYFYPKDDTPGCTIEANQFSQFIDEFSALDTVVYGVSKDNCASHVDFISKFSLQVGLLADTEGKLCDAYGVWQEKEKKDVKKMGIVRSTFVIDKEGIIRYAEYGVVAEGHAQLILDVVKKL
ncbi:MAG: peroxiredoxin, partial [Gammaproteobacteria bacterium]